MRLNEINQRLQEERLHEPVRLSVASPQDDMESYRRGARGPRKSMDTPLKAVVEHLVKCPATLVEVEMAAIEAALIAHNDNVSRAAKHLDIGRTTLYRKMCIYGMVTRRMGQ